MPVRPWGRLSERQVRAALDAWAKVPGPVRSVLVPIGRLVNPHSVTSAPAGPGVETVPETRAEWLDDHWLGPSQGLVWLVRSPWPSFAVTDALGIVWSHVERDRHPNLSTDRMLEDARYVLHLPEDEVRSLA